MAKYYRQVFSIEVLGTSPMSPDVDTLSIGALIEDGEYSGVLTLESTLEVTAAQMKELLENQGSDPEFLLGEEDMGDRCTVEINVLARKAKSLKKSLKESVFGEPATEEEKGAWVYLTYNEVPDAGVEVLDALAQERGMVFYGNHGRGDAYDAGEFAAVGNQFTYASVTRDGRYAVAFDANGKIDKESALAGKMHWKLVQKAKSKGAPKGDTSGEG